MLFHKAEGMIYFLPHRIKSFFFGQIDYCIVNEVKKQISFCSEQTFYSSLDLCNFYSKVLI